MGYQPLQVTLEAPQSPDYPRIADWTHHPDKLSFTEHLPSIPINPGGRRPWGAPYVRQGGLKNSPRARGSILLVYKVESHSRISHPMGYHDLWQAASAVVAASVVYALYRGYNRPSVKDIPGPPNPSWVHGRIGGLVPSSTLLITILKDTGGIG